MSGISKSRNRIFVIRHGESEANVGNLIVSRPDNGLHQWGLTEKGRLQAQEVQTDNGCINSDSLSSFLVFVSSDFRRTRETAEIMHSHFRTKSPLRFDPRLRERDFGMFDMTDSANYYKVWEEDLKDMSHTSYECESVSGVFSRTSLLIQELEDEYKNKFIVLVSHGDTLQITRTAYSHFEPNKHRQLPRLGNCDIVELKKANFN